MDFVARFGKYVLPVLVLAGLAAPAAGQVRGLSYTVSPLVERVAFDGNAGLEDAFLLGGRLGFGFGRYAELNAFYLFDNDVATDFSGLTGVAPETLDRLAALDGRSLRLQRYGGHLKLNVPRGALVPYFVLGSGLVRFAPDSLNASRTIFLSAGGGLQYTASSRYAVTFGLEHMMYRYNLGASFFGADDLAAAGLGPESFRQVQVGNWVVRAGLQFYLGGRAPGEETELDRALRQQLAGGLRGLSLRLEPFYGSVGFNDALAFPEHQRVQGFYAGLNLGPYLGVRGFYWRGLSEGAVLFDFDRVQGYGGEMRFRLGEGRTLTPFLTFGGGYLDVLSGYRGRDGGEVGDEPFLSGGVGALLPIGDAVSLTGSARTLLTSSEGAANVDDPGDVFGSWMYSAGVNVALGGRGATAGDVLETELERREAAALSREERLQAALDRSLARLDSLALVVELLERGDTTALRMLRVDALAPEPTLAGIAPAPGRADTAATPARQQFVTIPLPETGELYVRYGEPGGVRIETRFTEETTAAAPAQAAAPAPTSAPAGSLTAARIEQIVRETVQEQLRAREEATMPAAAVERLEERVETRLDEIEEVLEARLAERLQAGAPPTVVVDRTGAAAQPAAVRPARAPAVLPFTAVVSGTPSLFGLGVRADLSRAFFRPLRFQPELVVGIGGDTYAYHLNLDVAATAGFLERWAADLRPYAATGLGMLGFDEAPEDAPGVELTFNLRAGTEFALGGSRLFVEYATYDLFDYDRFGVGYRVGL